MLRKFNVFKDASMTDPGEKETLKDFASDIYRRICSNNPDVIENSLRHSRITAGKLKKYLTRRFN